jgi:hypothetical protein
MDKVLSDAVQAVSQVDPQSVAVQAVEAAVTTAADPSPMAIVSDLELAYTLLAEFKAKIAGLHPSVANIFKALF